MIEIPKKLQQPSLKKLSFNSPCELDVNLTRIQDISTQEIINFQHQENNGLNE